MSTKEELPFVPITIQLRGVEKQESDVIDRIQNDHEIATRTGAIMYVLSKWHPQQQLIADLKQQRDDIMMKYNRLVHELKAFQDALDYQKAFFEELDNGRLTGQKSLSVRELIEQNENF